MALRRIAIVSGSYLCAALLWLIVGGPPRSAAAEIPEPVRQALEANARSLNPITIAWERTRTSDLPRPRALTIVGDETSSFFLPNKSRFMWDNGRFYVQTVHLSRLATDPTDASPNKTLSDVAFDGQKRYALTKFHENRSDPLVIIDTPTTLSILSPRSRFLEADFFYETGFHFPERAEDYIAKRPAIISLPLYLIEQGARVIEVGREEVDGVSCTALVLRSETAGYRFLLDPMKNYAVRRRVETSPSGEVARRAHCSDFTRLPGSGLWMPRKVEVGWHTWLKALPKPVKEAVVRETYLVSEIKSEPIPPAQFVLKDFKPSTVVSDGTIEGKKGSSGRVSYIIPADPGRLDEVINAAASGKSYEPSIVSFRRKFILANVLLILILIGVVWWRVGRKSR